MHPQAPLCTPSPLGLKTAPGLRARRSRSSLVCPHLPGHLRLLAAPSGPVSPSALQDGDRRRCLSGCRGGRLALRALARRQDSLTESRLIREMHPVCSLYAFHVKPLFLSPSEQMFQEDAPRLSGFLVTSMPSAQSEKQQQRGGAGGGAAGDPQVPSRIFCPCDLWLYVLRPLSWPLGASAKLSPGPRSQRAPGTWDCASHACSLPSPPG